MSREMAKKYLEKIMADEMLYAQLKKMGPEEVLAFAGEQGFDITADELEKEVRTLRATGSGQVQEIDLEDMDKVAGGMLWEGENAPDGHELGCAFFYHGKSWARENKVWCKNSYYCYANFDECVKISRAGDECYLGYR